MDGFGNYTDTTKVVLKVPTTGDSYKSQEGNSFSEQTGNSVSNQTGNKDAWQHGYSNSVIVGMSFSTSLAATFSTTVGMSVSATAGLKLDTHLGAKVALFLGLEASINSSAAVKVTKGGTYTFDTVTKWETTDQKRAAVRKEQKIADNVKRVINEEISVYADGSSEIAQGDILSMCRSHRTSCRGDIELQAEEVNIRSVTCNLLGSQGVVITSYRSVTIDSPAKVTIRGQFINIG